MKPVPSAVTGVISAALHRRPRAEESGSGGLPPEALQSPAAPGVGTPVLTVAPAPSRCIADRLNGMFGSRS
jgi:hypothetical protein